MQGLPVEVIANHAGLPGFRGISDELSQKHRGVWFAQVVDIPCGVWNSSSTTPRMAVLAGGSRKLADAAMDRRGYPPGCALVLGSMPRATTSTPRSGPTATRGGRETGCRTTCVANVERKLIEAGLLVAVPSVSLSPEGPCNSAHARPHEIAHPDPWRADYRRVGVHNPAIAGA